MTAVGTLMAGMGDILKRLLGPCVRLSIDTGQGGLGVVADPTQFEAAIMNLAMETSTGGILN